MKLKSFFLLSILITYSLSLFACSDKPEQIMPTLTVEVKSVNLSADASSREIPIKTNVESWTVNVQGDAQSWLEARKFGNSLRITSTANSSFDTRKGEIKVVADNLSETITVQQMGQAPAILLDQTDHTVQADGGDFTLVITSNIEYEVILPASVEWISAKEGRATRAAMVTDEYHYSTTFNTSTVERETEITIRQIGGTLEQKVTVTQKGQGDFVGSGGGDIKDDIKVPVARGKASSQAGFATEGPIELSFDDNMNTIYHSAYNNNADDYWPITLEYFFENQESVDYLVYYPRPSGSNGHFKETEIWITTQSNPTYVKVMDFDFKGSSSATKVTFEESVVKPTAIKFVVKSGTGDRQGFAACAEMEFYRINPDNFDPLTLFIDETCTELKPGITLETIAKISNNLYRNMALHIYNKTYPREFRIAEYKAWPHPDDWARVNKTSTLSLLDNPTGISVSEGEDLIVFVGNTHGHTLSLKVQNLNRPNGDGYNDGSSYYPLSRGVNKLRMRNRGLVYLFYHTSDYQTALPVKVHFASGRVNGYFDSQKHQASDWRKYLDAAIDDNFDVIGEHAHLTFPTSAFRTHAANNGPALIDAYDDLVRLQKEFMGLMKYNRPTINRNYFHVMYHSFMYATSYRTAYNATTLADILNVNTLKTTAVWGPAHEVGHTFQTRPGFRWTGMTEVTTNVHSLWVQTEWGNPSRIETENMGRYSNRYEKAFHNAFVKRIPHPAEEDVFCKLVSLWQLQLYFANVRGQVGTYKDLYEKVRTSPDLSTAGEQQLEFVRMMSDITQTNLIDFFQKWGYLSPYDEMIDDYGSSRFLITQRQIDETIAYIEEKNYPLLIEKMEYISDSNWDIFKNRFSIQSGTAQRNENSITMNNWRNVVAYEVYEGDTLVFVSNKNSFNLDSPATTNKKVYAVAFDGRKMEVTF
ncbi:MAG: M60 family metallopeptidase [Dysgonamonadaceae bacterium]|jgi:hypothetical protein|nr:M60 family metallopeptidase [Dysgonamonadaceae bacterium]